MRTQTLAGLTPEPKLFQGSYGFFGRRVGPKACFKIHLLHPGGKHRCDDSISGKSVHPADQVS